MKVLAFDTSSDTGGITLLGSEKGIVRLKLNDTNRIAESIYSLVDRVLKEAETETGKIDLFSSVLGPGSFTGLRVSLSVIKAFAFALGKPVFGTDTMKLMAYEALKIKNSERMFIIQNARRDEVFFSSFDSRLNEIEKIRIIPASLVAGLVRRENMPVVFREDEIRDLIPEGADGIQIEKDLSLSCAELSVRLYDKCCNNGSASDIEPIYVRNDIVRKKL